MASAASSDRERADRTRAPRVVADETKPSAARDVAAGRRSELDAILGAVLRVAERHDVPCPTLTELAVTAGLR